MEGVEARERRGHTTTTGPASPLPDKGIGGRGEPRMRWLKGGRQLLPRRQRSPGTRGQVSHLDRWGRATGRPVPSRRLVPTVIVTIPRPHRGPSAGTGSFPPASPTQPLCGGESVLGPAAPQGYRVPALLPSWVSVEAGGGASLGRLPG